MKIKDIMTKSVASVNPTATLADAAKLMQQHNVGSIPVCDQNGVVGIITDRDIVVRNVATGGNPGSTQVKDIMTAQVTTAAPDMDVDDVSRMMASNQIRRVPVVDNNRLVGMVALGDMAVDQRFDTEASEALTEISKPNGKARSAR
jgi:CBS domain-containing protein